MTDEGAGVSRRGDATMETLVPEDWRVAWDSSPALIVVTLGPSHRLAYQNRSVQAMFGVRPLGVRLDEAFPELGAVGLAPLDEVLETGEVVDVPARPVSVRDVAGGEVCLRYVLAPLGAPPVGVVTTAIDVTAEARAEQTAERIRLLADISTRITAARSAGEGLQSLTDGLVPAVADVAAVYVTPDVNAADTGAALPPEVVSLSTGLTALGPLPRPSARDEPAPWASLLAAGNAVILPVDESTLPVLAPDPETSAWLQAAEANSIAVVPLVVAGTLSGALVLLAGGERPPFGESDLPFLQDVTARAGIAISQVRSTRQHRDIALGLQRALLPPAPPTLPGFNIVARYVAGAPQVQVGGDWWDVQGVGAGHVAVGIGDVAGRGIRAAAVMGHARAAMRAAGGAALPPAGVLELLDAQLAEVLVAGDPEAPTPQFATACYAIVRPEERLIRVANAGHMPLLVRGGDGSVRVVAVPPGPPLGLGIGGYREGDVPFGTGEILVMFTDGLVESRTEDLDVGIAELASALRGSDPDSSLDAIADGLLRQMGRQHANSPDDVALVLLRLGEGPDRGQDGGPPQQDRAEG
jgi:hypothetical protein